jgi:uncharacterized membrane protein
MHLESIIKIIGALVADGLEVFGICVIGIAFLHAVVRAFFHVTQGRDAVFLNLRIFIGKALQLALEFLVAADIIRTVIIDLTIKGLLSLGMLIILRTLLSWSITLEIEGRWPWQPLRERKV